MRDSCDWKHRPTLINNISDATADYVVGIDECGNPSLTHLANAKKRGILFTRSELSFTAVACLYARRHLAPSCEEIERLKANYWNGGTYIYKEIVKKVCLHSREIRGKRGPFNPALINYDQFITDLSNLMIKQPMTLVSAHVDKLSYIERDSPLQNPYYICLEHILEQIIHSIKPDESCTLILESRGAREDRVVLNQLVQLVESGSTEYNSEPFTQITGIYFNPKWTTSMENYETYWILEMADLCSHPIHVHYVTGSKNRAFLAVEPKLMGYPTYKNIGMKTIK